VLGHVFEYFLGEFALAEGKKGGQAGFVLAKGSLTSKTSGEGDILKELIEARLVDCIVNLPAKLFLNTQLPAGLWFLSRNKANGKFRNRTDEILFIDARNMGHLINRRTREFAAEDIATIAGEPITTGAILTGIMKM